MKAIFEPPGDIKKPQYLGCLSGIDRNRPSGMPINVTCPDEGRQAALSSTAIPIWNALLTAESEAGGATPRLHFKHMDIKLKSKDIPWIMHS